MVVVLLAGWTVLLLATLVIVTGGSVTTGVATLVRVVLVFLEVTLVHQKSEQVDKLIRIC